MMQLGIVGLVVGEVGGGYTHCYRIEIRSVLTAKNGVRGHILFGGSIPSEPHTGCLLLSLEAGGSRGSLQVGSHIDRQEAPLLIVATSGHAHLHIGTCGFAAALHLKTHSTVLAADVEGSVASILQEPLLVVAQTAREATHVAPCRKAPVEDIELYIVLGVKTECIVTEVATDGLSHRLYVPLQKGLSAILALRSRNPIAARIGGKAQEHSAAHVHYLVGTVDVGHDVHAALHIHNRLGIGLPLLIACSARQVHDVFASGQSVEPYGTVQTDKAELRSHSLSFAGAAEGLHRPVGVAIERSSRPIAAVFAIGQSLARIALIGSLHELAATVFASAPPDARLHAILHSDHGLHRIMKFVGSGMVTIAANALKE